MARALATSSACHTHTVHSRCLPQQAAHAQGGGEGKRQETDGIGARRTSEFSLMAAFLSLARLPSSYAQVLTAACT